MSDDLLSRRRVLGAALAGGALAACSSARPRAGLLGAFERANQAVQRLLLSGRAAGRPDDAALTPEAAFPVYHASPFAPEPPADWRLEIGGLVARPRRLSLADLVSLPRTDVRLEHHCVEGWSAVADWHGVRLRDIAELVGADARAEYVEFRSFDSGYWSSWDRESAMHRQTLLAYGMNGRPLGRDHGAPVRVYGAVKLGYKQVKYLTKVRFLAEPTGGFWENTGYEWYAGV